MTRDQENRLNMFFTTQEVLVDHNATWGATPAMVDANAAFDANIAALRTAVARQVTDITGHAKDKARALDALVALTLRMSGCVMAYAETTDNQALAEAMNIVPSELYKYRDSIVAERCQGVHDAANTHIANLAPYGIVAADVNSLQSAIDKYVALIPRPRTKITERKGATSEIGLLIRDTQRLLGRRMDMLMRGFMISHPDFYRQYQNARIIVDQGGQKEELPAVA